MAMRSPSVSRTGEVTFVPPRFVPFLLPKSCSHAASIPERVADFSDEVREICLGDVGRRPQPVLQDLLRKRFRTFAGEHGEQLERLGREVQYAIAASELSGVEIERERSETNRHGRRSDHFAPKQ